MNEKKRIFVSGNDAVALGAGLARPDVISAYPITPQTIVVERLSEMVEDGSLKAEFLHVESEHSAMSAAMGASAVGARAFTATSSQGLLYMAEGLYYAAGGRFPIVMMNANRSLALPWSIYGDQSDSMSQLNCGWIQVYVEDAQEALDMVIQAYKIAEDPGVLTPFMINLDGFVLTHTYEVVELPSQEEVDRFLPPFTTHNKMSFSTPMNMGMSTSPNDNQEYKFQQHRGILNAAEAIVSTDRAYGELTGRSYGGFLDAYRCEDADAVLITVGSVTGTVRGVVDTLRKEGSKVGLLKIRYMRPFPQEELRALCKNFSTVGAVDRNISFGYEGTVFTNVCSALSSLPNMPVCKNFICGLGGRDISQENVKNMFRMLLEGNGERVNFIGMKVAIS